MNKIKFEHVRIIIYIISIILVILVVSGKIKTSCFWYDNYKILCPSCGLTRATNNILKFNFSDAFKNNAFYTAILFPFLIILLLNDIYVLLKRYIFNKADISYVEILLGYSKYE